MLARQTSILKKGLKKSVFQFGEAILALLSDCGF